MSDFSDTSSDPLDLTGKLLIAMPDMGDPRFVHSVVFLCSHTEEGAMGLIVNKPAGELQLSELLQQMDMEPAAPSEQPVYFGGPVETGRGFVLHSPDYGSPLHTLEVTKDIGMTATMDVLEDIAAGGGPERALMLLGYAGWGPGQLEDELGHNGWLTTEASADLVFGLSDAQKWSAALKTLGIDPVMLSGAAGRA